MIAAAVTDASIKNVPRSLAQKLFHAATTVKNLNSSQSMIAVAHTLAHVIDQSVSHSVIVHVQKVTFQSSWTVTIVVQLLNVFHVQLKPQPRVITPLSQSLLDQLVLSQHQLHT